MGDGVTSAPIFLSYQYFFFPNFELKEIRNHLLSNLAKLRLLIKLRFQMPRGRPGSVLAPYRYCKKQFKRLGQLQRLK